MTTTICLKQIVYWAFHVLVDMWDEVLTRWSSSRTMCCVPSRSSSWSPCSVSLSAAAWCHSPPRSTTDPLHFRIAEYLRRNIENTSTRETVSTSANIARTCQTMESLMNTALRSVSRRGAKRLRVEISKTGGGGGHPGLDRMFRCCTQGPCFPGAGVKDIWEDRIPGARVLCRETHRVEVVGVLAAHCIYTPDLWVSAQDVSSVALCSLSWACFLRSSPISLFTASSSSCTKCSLNVSLTALKDRSKSAIKASNSETMVNVC